MVGFIIIVIVILLIVAFNSGKQKKPQKYQQRRPVQSTVPPRRNQQYLSVQQTLVPQTQLPFLNDATQHFGKEWQVFLMKWSAKLNITNQLLREGVAAAYQKLSPKERQDLFSTFLADGKTNYDELHTGVYRLLLDRRFKQEYLVSFFRKLIEEQKKPKPAKPSADPIESLQSIFNSVSNTHATVVESDPSIIEVDSEPLKIDYGLNQAPALVPVPVLAGLVKSTYESVQSPFIQPLQYDNGYNYDPDQYKLGTLYKTKLRLSPQEVQWLNKFYPYSNTFNNIEGAAIVIMKLYLLGLKKIVRRFANDSYTLLAITEDICNAVVKQQKNQYTSISAYDAGHIKSQAEGELYYTFYKKAELAVREYWDHKRKISAEFSIAAPEALSLFEKHLEPVMDMIIQDLKPVIGVPDEETEILLNVATTTRWKIKFDAITTTLTGDEVIKALYELGKLNSKNPAVENVYYEASKFLADKNQLESLRFYLHYIYHDLKSVKIDNKALNKTIQKKLFASEEQLNEFQAIVTELSQSQKLGKALDQVNDLYRPKRKKIILDTEQIRSVRQQHSGTVDILNTYLQDEDEDIAVITMVPVAEAVSNVRKAGTKAPAVPLNDLQLKCLQLFETNGHQLATKQLETFAVTNSTFKNQLIDSINESFYELLDDILIEEEDDLYVINALYINRIYLL